MAKCNLHPGRDSVTKIFGKEYCQICKQNIEKARSQVDKHVEPKECMVWYVGHDKWEAIPGTGCAHWMAHQKDIHVGTEGAKCLAGFTYRVPVLMKTRKKIASNADVKVDDWWASPSLDHCGIVIRVIPPLPSAKNPTVTIRHDSSRQGKVAENSWETYFHSAGAFYR
jgi:hypothetical protein